LSAAGLTWYGQQVNESVGDLLREASQPQAGADGWQADPRNPNNAAAGFDFHDTTSAHREQPTDSQAVTAILECLTNEIQELVGHATGGATIEQLIAIGGGAQSDLWLKMIARQLRIPVVRPTCIEASALGAARFAALAAGQIDSLADFEPQADAVYEPI
jgi:xylulokinase